MEQYLTAPELKALAELKTVDHDSIWGIAIKNVVSATDPMRLRRLICELKSQNSDNPGVMRRILGHAYEAVVSL